MQIAANDLGIAGMKMGRGDSFVFRHHFVPHQPLFISFSIYLGALGMISAGLEKFELNCLFRRYGCEKQKVIEVISIFALIHNQDLSQNYLVIFHWKDKTKP